MTTTDRHLHDTLTDARAELAQWDLAVIARILDRASDHLGGFPSGTEPAAPTIRFDETGKVIPADHPDNRIDIDYSDRTGEIVATGRTPELTNTTRLELLRASRDLQRCIDTFRRARHALGILYDHECCRTHLLVGVREPVARGRYARYCRPCGEDRARNDRQDTPAAIMQALVTGGAISDQLLAAHLLPNGKRWKRRPVSARRPTRR